MKIVEEEFSYYNSNGILLGTEAVLNEASELYHSASYYIKRTTYDTKEIVNKYRPTNLKTIYHESDNTI